MGRAEDGPVVGVDAVHFLERFRHPSKEPLVPALGGFPMGLEAFIEKAVREIQSVGCRLWFYFDGLDCAFETPSFGPSISAMNTVSEALSLYETASEAAKAIERFRQSGMLLVRLWNSALTRCRLPRHGFSDPICQVCSAQVRHSILRRAVQGLCPGEPC